MLSKVFIFPTGILNLSFSVLLFNSTGHLLAQGTCHELMLVSPLAAFMSSIFALVFSEVCKLVLSANFVEDEQLHSNLTTACTLSSTMRWLLQVAILSENYGKRMVLELPFCSCYSKPELS